MPNIPLSPWPLGQDTFHTDPYDAVFEPQKDAPSRLMAAVNCDLDVRGNPHLRSGTVQRVSGTDIKRGGGSFGGLMLVQDGGTIYKVDPTTYAKTELVTGLNSSLLVSFLEFGGKVYWANRETTGMISAGAATHWGLTTPPAPTLAATAGTLDAGTYRVQVTFQGIDGREHSASTASTITLASAGGISVDLSSVDPNAAFVNIYAGGKHQKEPFWVQKVSVGAFPVTVDDVAVSTRPCYTNLMTGPVPGDGLFKYKGLIFVWRDNWLFRSIGTVPHIFNPRENIFGFSDNIRQGLGLEDGLYVATEKGLHWVTGEPGKWRKDQVDSGGYLSGGLVLPGNKVPALETSAKVALFVSSDGLVAGLPGGVTRKLIDDRWVPPADAVTCHLSYREHNGMTQLLLVSE